MSEDKDIAYRIRQAADGQWQSFDELGALYKRASVREIISTLPRCHRVDDDRSLADEFANYCREHPEERFWQALRNWSGCFAIYCRREGTGGIEDTFFMRGKDE